MKFSLHTFPPLHGLIFVGMLAATGAAMAQTEIGVAAVPATSASGNYGAGTLANAGSSHPMMGQRDPAKMQARMEKRMSGLKTKLMITPAQEGAWTAFSAAMQPSATMHAPDTAAQTGDDSKLTTPDRIDKIRALRSQRMSAMTAAMDQRGEATKRFYAALNADQQKTFDAEYLKMMQGRGHHYGGDHHDGDRADGPMKH